MAIQSDSKITNNEYMTQKEVAEIIGVSRCAIQQIENRAIKKIIKELQRRNIKLSDLL